MTKIRKFFDSSGFKDTERYFTEHQNCISDKKEIEELGGRFMREEETWELPFQNLFESLISYSDGKDGVNQSLPLPIYCNVAFPYEIDEHEDLMINNHNLEQIITSFINSNFEKNKYIFTGDRSHGIAISLHDFNYQFFSILLRHVTSSWILFDEKIDKAFIYTYNSSLSVLTQKIAPQDFVLDGKGTEFWGKFFCEYYQSGYRWRMTDGRCFTDEEYKYFVSDYGGRLSHPLPEHKI